MEKKYVSARQGERYGPEKQKAAFRRGIDQKELSVYALPFENGLFFFKPAEVQRRTNFLNGVFCGLSDREARKLSGPQRSDKAHDSADHRNKATKLSGATRTGRSEATKWSGARMPEQRRAGQLVYIYIYI